MVPQQPPTRRTPQSAQPRACSTRRSGVASASNVQSRRRELADLRVDADGPRPALSYHRDCLRHGADIAVHDIHDAWTHRYEDVERSGEVHVGQIETHQAVWVGAPPAAYPQPDGEAGLKRRLHRASRMACVLHHLQGNEVYAAVREDRRQFPEPRQLEVGIGIVGGLHSRRQVRDRSCDGDVLARRVPRLGRELHGHSVDVLELVAEPGRLEEKPRGAERIGDDHLGPGGDVVFMHRSHHVGVAVDREARPGGFAHRHAPALEFGSSPAVYHNNLITFDFFFPRHDGILVWSRPEWLRTGVRTIREASRHLAAEMLQVRLTNGQPPGGRSD